MPSPRAARTLLLLLLASLGHLGRADADPDPGGALTDPTGAGFHCERAYGQLACGFACLAGYGTIACTRTPAGVCTSGYGKVLCWDPPVDPRGAQARCVSGYGQLACGFACVSGYGRVACAQTPWGACTSGYGEVRCVDPRDRPRWRSRRAR